MKSVHSLYFVLILLMLLPATVPGSLPAPDADQVPDNDTDDLAMWHQGPMRYLLRGVEVDFFRSLKTDPERLAFINRFWDARDPDPLTTENPARQEYWQRVAMASSLFTRTTVPGWRTDMGRIFITLGPPDARAYDPFPSDSTALTLPMTTLNGKNIPTTFGAAEPLEVRRGVEIWTYNGLKAATLSTGLTIAFRKMASGDYELSSDPRDFSQFGHDFSSMVSGTTEESGANALAGLVIAQSNYFAKLPLYETDKAFFKKRGFDKKAQPPFRETDEHPFNPKIMTNRNAGYSADPYVVPIIELTHGFNRLALNLDMGRIGSVPRFEDFIGEVITSWEFHGVMPFQVSAQFFATTLDSTLATVTVGLPRQVLDSYGIEPDDLEMAVRLQGVDQPDYRRILAGRGTFITAPAADSEPGQLVMQTVTQVPPGRYSLSVGVHAPGHDLVASVETPVEAPAFRHPDLSLSTLCLAHSLRRSDEQGPVTQTNAVAPFRLGNYYLVPRVNRDLGPDDHLTIYYQVYGAGLQDGSPLLRTSYELSRLDEDGERPVGEPILFNDLRQAVQGWSVPVKGWPEGNYRLRVAVEDRVNGTAAGGELLFSIHGPELISTVTSPSR